MAFFNLLQKRFQNPVKHLSWSVLLLPVFAKHSILDVWKGTKYIFVLILQLLSPD